MPAWRPVPGRRRWLLTCQLNVYKDRLGLEIAHTFRQEAGGTVMVDEFTYRSPLGLLGALADKLFLERYMRAFLEERARALKQMAESDDPGQTP